MQIYRSGDRVIAIGPSKKIDMSSAEFDGIKGIFMVWVDDSNTETNPLNVFIDEDRLISAVNNLEVENV